MICEVARPFELTVDDLSPLVLKDYMPSTPLGHLPMHQSIQPYPQEEPRAQLGPLAAESSDGPRKRSKLVRLACNPCRQTKAKCDGERPSCSGCLARGRECTYDGKPGDTRHGAMKSRLAVLEKLMRSLQTSLPSEANHLLRRIRSAKDIAALAETSATTSPSASEEPQSPLEGARFRYPQADFDILNSEVVHDAVDAFYSCVCELFHVFSREQAEDMREKLVTQTGLAQQAATSCVAAIAAAGARYWNTALHPSVEEGCYDMARHSFDKVLEYNPFDAIKVCTLLAMFNIVDKAAVAVTWVEIGLCTSRRLGLHQNRPAPGVSHDLWLDYRKSWRTLLFFASWLTSTLGYLSENDPVSVQAPLAEPVVDESEDIVDILQEQLIKIASLKVNIIRAEVNLDDSGIRQAEAVMAELQSWLDQMPQEMRLTNSHDLKPRLRRSIYYVHLVYNGAILLLFRLLLCQYYRLYGFGREHGIAGPSLQKLSRIMREGVTAASNSAIIMTSLLGEDNLLKRCWIVSSQACISALVLLYVVSQKQLHEQDNTTYQDELSYAHQCLEIFAYRASQDPIARRFRESLTNFYNHVWNNCNAASHSTQSQDTVVAPDAFAAYLFTIPNNATPEKLSVSLRLAFLLSDAFSYPGGSEEGSQINFTSDPTRHDFARMIERFDWQLENSRPFQWSTEGGGGGGMGEQMESSVEHPFMGSLHRGQRLDN